MADFLEKFDLPTDDGATMQRVLGEERAGPAAVRVLYIELLILQAFSKVEANPGSADAKNDFKGLTTKLAIFLSSNELGVCQSDVHAGLWAAAMGQTA